MPSPESHHREYALHMRGRDLVNRSTAAAIVCSSGSGGGGGGRSCGRMAKIQQSSPLEEHIDFCGELGYM